MIKAKKKKKIPNDPWHDSNEVGILYRISHCKTANGPTMWNSIQSNGKKKSCEKINKVCLIVHLS